MVCQNSTTATAVVVEPEVPRHSTTIDRVPTPDAPVGAQSPGGEASSLAADLLDFVVPHDHGDVGPHVLPHAGVEPVSEEEVAAHRRPAVEKVGPPGEAGRWLQAEVDTWIEVALPLKTVALVKGLVPVSQCPTWTGAVATGPEHLTLAYSLVVG